MSPVTLVVRRDFGLESVILWNHGKKAHQATEESLRELAGDCMGSDVVQNLVTGAATEVSAWISLQFYSEKSKSSRLWERKCKKVKE